MGGYFRCPLRSRFAGEFSMALLNSFNEPLSISNSSFIFTGTAICAGMFQRLQDGMDGEFIEYPWPVEPRTSSPHSFWFPQTIRMKQDQKGFGEPFEAGFQVLLKFQNRSTVFRPVQISESVDGRSGASAVSSAEGLIFRKSGSY